MNDTTDQQSKKSGGGSKRLISIILVAVLLIGGSIAAYAFINKSPKNKYFLAEKKSSEFIMDIIDQRFSHELEWRNKVEENPSESTYVLSAQMNSGPSLSTGLFSPEQIVNNSNLTLTTTKDLDNKIMSTGLTGSVAGVEIEGFEYTLTAEELLVDLPFEDDLIQIKGQDVGQVLHSLDPYSVDEDLEVDFSTLFDWMEGYMSEEDKEYFKEEYIKMIYDEIPNDAFKTDKEKVTIDGNSVNTDKITMHLSEKNVKGLLSSVAEKMANDEHIKEKLDDLYNLINIGESVDATMNVDEFIGEFEEGMEEIIEEINELSIPEGITSTIWVKKNLIVQREFILEMGTSDADLVSFDINGTQLLTDNEQSFEYEFGVEDEFDQETVFLIGDFSINKEKATDSIELSDADYSIRYEATEKIEDNKKDFDRSISFDDTGIESKILWTGTADYDKEEMSSNHELNVDDADVDSDMFSINIEKEAKLAKDVEQPTDKDIKNLGSMSDTELMEYFQYELPNQLEEWLYGSMDTMW